MGLPPHDSKLPEVFIKCYKNSAFLGSPCQDFIVAGINFPLSCLHDLVSGCLKRGLRATPFTGIKQKFHEADSSGKGSMRSWPTSRWA